MRSFCTFTLNTNIVDGDRSSSYKSRESVDLGVKGKTAIILFKPRIDQSILFKISKRYIDAVNGTKLNSR